MDTAKHIRQDNNHENDRKAAEEQQKKLHFIMIVDDC